MADKKTSAVFLVHHPKVVLPAFSSACFHFCLFGPLLKFMKMIIFFLIPIILDIKPLFLISLVPLLNNQSIEP